jgi:hypothetical protein
MVATVIYFALADWLYIARLAGYVCIVEMPEAVLIPSPSTPPVAGPPVQTAPVLDTAIDRDELILSDVPNLLPSGA